MDDELATALRAYTAKGTSAFPKQMPQAVIAIFGDEMLSRIEALFHEVDELHPDWTTHSLASATDWARAKLKARHPELSSDSLETLGWALSYGWK